MSGWAGALSGEQPAVHQGLVIERITAIIPFFNREVGKELLYFAESNYTAIKSIDKLDKK